MTDFGWDLPPGVTQSMIDDRYANADEERAMDVIDRWLAADPGWWRRYVKADDRGRRRDLLDARLDTDAPDDVWPLDLADYLEGERGSTVRHASRMARYGVLAARRAQAAS